MKNTIKQACGAIASQVFRSKTLALAKGELAPEGMVDQLISEQLIRKAAENGDHSALRNQLANYWQGAAADYFYEAFTDRFEEWFLNDHYAVVETLKEIVAESPNKYKKLYEIGCGDGQVLSHLSRNLPQIDHFTGLDLNEKIIDRNSDFYINDKMSFEAGDAAGWLDQNADEGSVVMTYGGVFEYFLEDELKNMLAMLKQKSPVTLALVEPLYEDYDLSTETKSRTSGKEHSFSHNYRHLLTEAGFEIQFEQEPEMEFRWIMMVATG